MSCIQCDRCGIKLAEGSLKYQVAVRVRSMFDGVIPEAECGEPAMSIDRILEELACCTEEELTHQVYEDDVFILCPRCKDDFLNEVYSRLTSRPTPDSGRAHLIN